MHINNDTNIGMSHFSLRYSYFKYRDDVSSSSPKRDNFQIRVDDQTHHQVPTFDERSSRISNKDRHARFADDAPASPTPVLKREHSPTPTNISILPGEHESPLDRERKKKKLAAELQAQINLKAQEKQREKQSRKNMDYKYLYDSITHDPFGRMGAGAPIRDQTGHIVAHRLKMFDEAAATSFHKSFYKHQEEVQHLPEQVDKKSIMQNLNEEEIGLQFLSWSNQEKKRKEMQREEWKRSLDEQQMLIQQKKAQAKQKKLQDDLRLEEKIRVSSSFKLHSLNSSFSETFKK
jgi:hypothetical protein